MLRRRFARLRRVRHDGDDGAVMAETAIVVAVLLVPLLFGILEFGLLFKDLLTLENGTRAGARVGAGAANTPTADRQIVDAVGNATASLPAGAVKKVVVYAATEADGRVPDICKTQSDATARCNHYSGAALATGAALDDSAWPPSTRINESQTNVDFVGVWVQMEHGWVTGFFGSGRTMSDSVVMRLEPTPRLKPPPTTTTTAAPTTTTSTSSTTTSSTTSTTAATTSTTAASTTSTTQAVTTTTASTTTTTAAPTTTTASTTTTTTIPPPPPPPPSRG